MRKRKERENSKNISDERNQSDVVELEERENPNDALEEGNQIDNDEHQMSENKYNENVCYDEFNVSFDWRNYAFSERELADKFVFEICDIPNFWKARVQQLMNYLKKRGVSSNQSTGPFKEIRFACKILTDHMRKFKEDHEEAACTMEKMMPFFARMMAKDMASNVSGNSTERNTNLASDQFNAEFEVEWIRPKELPYSAIFSELLTRENLKKGNANNSTDKTNNEMIIVTQSLDGTTPEMIVITSKIKEKSLKLDDRGHSVIAPNGKRRSTVAPNGRGDSDVAPNRRTDSDVAPNRRTDSDVAPNGGRDSDVFPNGGRDSDVASNGGRDSDVVPNGGSDSDVAPDGGRDSDVASNGGRDSDVAPKGSSVTAANKQLHCVEVTDIEVASVSGVSEVAYKTEEMNPETQAEIESKKANITQNIIKSIISCGDSVQKASRTAIRNAELLLQDICEKKAVGQAMKANNLLTREQLESFDDEFNSYIKFAGDIRDYISDLIRYVNDIVTYVKRNEKKFLSNKDEALQQMTYFENQLCGHLLNFYEIALAGEKAREMFEKTKHEPIVISLPQESIAYEGMFINHLLNFAVFSRTFESAWDAGDAYLDILHCLFILLVDAEKIPDDSSRNLPFLYKFNVNGSHGTQINSDSPQKGATTSATAAPTMSEERNTEIPEEVISKGTTTPPENKAKASPKNKGKRKTNKPKKKRR